MAAEFVLTFAAEGLLTKVSSLAAQELSLAWGFKAGLKKLGESVSTLQDFLRGAADQKEKDRGKAVEDWVNKLRAVAEDADDVLDEFYYELLRRKVELQNHMKRKVLNFLSASNPLLFRLKMAHKIKKINESLVELKNEAPFINLVAKRRVSEPGGEGAPDREQTDSFFEKDEIVVGRGDVAKNIVETLINSNNQKNHSVMAIVGMAGLGKTTLAKSVFNETAIDAHFHKKMWVCVSNSFDVDAILRKMLESLKDPNAGSSSRDALISSLRDQLKEKKYVLVLDDVWSEERYKWDSLMSCLSKLNSTPGSSIIITTRSANVASIAETLRRPKLINLSNEECWSILKQRALPLEVNNEIDADRERIGMAIAEKCGGVPLVAKVLGSIMRSKTSRDEWLAIQNSEIWDLPEEADRIMSVLKLSFDNLKSSSLKQCFSYCSLLKKDFEIERDTLIQLWMAQGLLQPSSDKGHHEMEDTGNEYFNILLNNSLFQEVTAGGSITKYTMHDLVHDLAERVFKCESLTQDRNHTCEVRHVARIPTSRLENMSDVIARRLHSLFSDDDVPDIILSKFRALRVLNLHKASIQELSNSIGKLKHLRYLDVSYTGIQALPKSIGRLYNLQTLRMQGNDLKELPREMQNLINLRHLYFDEKVEFPAGMFKGLTKLRTMRYFNVDKQMGVGIEELAGLNQLKGEVTIGNLENVRDEEDAKKAKLEDKKNIHKLSFVWTERGEESEGVQEGLEGRQSCNNTNNETVLEGLQPHPNLKSLAIKNFIGDRFPSWMMRKPFPLNNLQKLLLVGCLKCECLPILGHLPSLTDVNISGMKNLNCLGSEFYGYDHVTGENDPKVLFPSLKTLSIGKCGELTEWMEAPTTRKLVVFPCLEELTIKSCPKLQFIPIDHDMASLRELRIGECDGLSSIGLLDRCTALQQLKIWSCGNLTSIPISEGLASLRELEIVGCDGLSSIGLLDRCTALQQLKIWSCGNLTSIPISEGLASLRELDILFCDGLSSIGLLDRCTALQQLKIWSCGNLTSIPISEGLASLRELKIWSCGNLTSIPISEGLASLRELEIVGCDGLSSIGLLDRCTALQQLKIWSCGNLTSIPISEGLASLRELDIGKCDGLSSIGLLDRCTALQQLKIWRCRNLTSIPISEGLASLRELDIGKCDGLSSIGLLDRCTALQQLKIWSCGNLTSIPISEGLASLRELDIGECDGLSSIGLLDRCTALQQLKIWRCRNLTSIPISEGLASLRKLDIGECDGLSSIGLLDRCTALQQLKIWRCRNLTSIPISEGLASLRKLDIGECDGLSSIGLLDRCTALQQLKIWSCGNLTSIPISEGLASLRELDILFCDGLSSIGLLDRCTALQQLKIWSCGNLTSIPISEGLASLRELDIGECDGLSSIGLLDRCTALQQLKIWRCRNLTSIPISEGLASLRKLEIGLFDGLTGLPSWIENCTSLEVLSIRECSSLATISFTRVLPSLQILTVWKCPKLASISCSTDFNPRLEDLRIWRCNGLQAIPDFRTFTSLRVLRISDCAGIESLVCGFHFPVSLQDLEISYFHNLESIPSLDKCASLRSLEVHHCEKLRSPPTTGLCCLAPLTHLCLGPFWEELDSFPDFQVPSQQLIESLRLYGWPKLKSLPQQAQHFRSLRELTIDSFNGVDVLPEWLGNLASLQQLHIYDCANLKYLPSLKAMERLTKLYSLYIRRCPLLKERCTKDSGEEWPKISHIPVIRCNASLEAAVNWVVEHENDMDIDEMPLVPVNSKGEAPKPSLTPEQLKAKQHELREKARKKKEEKEKRMEREREREKERIRVGKELLEAKRIEEDNERKRILALRKAEKEEEKRARERIRQKLEEDKAERRRKLGLPAEDPSTTKPSTPVVGEIKMSLPVRPATKAEQMRECLRSLKQNHKEDDAKVKRAFQTLLTFIGNVVKNPDEEKFRKIRLTNPSFQERVGSLMGGIQFLELCGFERMEGGEFVFLSRDKIDMAVFHSARSELDSAIKNPFFGVL